MNEQVGSRSLKTMRPVFRTFFLIIIYAFAAFILSYCFVTRGGLSSGNFSDHAGFSFSRAVYWTGPRPFMYRVLLPATVRLISEATPLGFRNRINEALIHKPFLHAMGWTTKYSYECIVALFLIFLLWMGMALMWRYLIHFFYGDRTFVSDLAPAAGLLVLPALFLSNSTTIYDPMTLFMSTLGVVLIVSRRYGLFYLFFPFAILSKFTALLLTGAFCANEFKRMHANKLALHVLAQGFIWAVVVSGLMYLLRDLPGKGFTFMLFWNLQGFLFEVATYHIVYSLGFFAMAAFLIFYGWKRKPVLLRRMFAVTAIIFIPAVLLFGCFVVELRVWYELYPLTLLLSVWTVCDLFEIPLAQTDEPHLTASP